MEGSKKEWLIIILLTLLLIALVILIVVYNHDANMCISDPLKYIEKDNKYCSCFCMNPTE
jgi:cytochrome c-type biogenesis protein CcmE